MKIGSVSLPSPFAIAPMAGMTDTAFRRLVKRHGGCGLVVTEMVSAEGLVRGIDRTLEYAEYTEEERPVSIQIFGGDPEKMAAAAQIVEGMGADIVDVNMGCPVPKIAKHNAGCSLMREPEQAATVIAAMAKAVKIPVTVKMRAGWNDGERNAPVLAKMVEDAGAAAVAVHGRTAQQSYSGSADWDLVAEIADRLTIPVFGSGDCIEPEQVIDRLRQGVDGVLVGRGVLRNPWILAQAADLAAGRPPRRVTAADRGRFLLDYIDLLMHERVHDAGLRSADSFPELRRAGEAAGFRHLAPSHVAQGSLAPPKVRNSKGGSPASRVAQGFSPARGMSSDVAQGFSAARGMSSDAAQGLGPARVARGHDRWVINKVRALGSWYTKGIENGSHMRTAINSAESIDQLRDIIETFFAMTPRPSALVVG